MIINDLFNNKKFVAEAIGDLGSKRDQGKTIRKWRKSRGLDEQGGAEGLNEFAPGNGGGESGRWYTDGELADIIGDDWFEDFDVSNDGFNIDAYGEKAKKNLVGYANAWFDDKGYNVNVIGVEHNDVDHDLQWYIVGSFQNSGFAKKGMAEDDDAVAAFLARGGEVQKLKPAKPRKGERWQGSAHIGAAGGRGTKGRVSGLAANTGKSGKPVVTAEQGVSEVSLGDYPKKAQLSQAMAQTNKFFDRDDPAKVAAADRTIAKRERGLARADARVKPYTPPAQDAEKMQRDLTAKYPNIDELVAAAEQRRDPNYDYAEGDAYYDGREAEQHYQKLKQIQRVIQGLNESKIKENKMKLNEAILNEDPVYRTWKTLGQTLVERRMSEKEILQVFADAESGMTDKATGANRTMLGRGKDTTMDFAGQVKDAVSGVLNSIQNSVPVAAVDVAYDQATDALANLAGGQKGKVMQAIKGYRNLVKQYPKTAGFAKAALVAIIGLATGGAGLPAIAGLTYALDSAIRGDKLSSVLGKGAGSAALAAAGQAVAGALIPDAAAATTADGQGSATISGATDAMPSRFDDIISNSVDYKVKPDDTLSDILADRKINPEAFKRLPGNDIFFSPDGNPNILKAGQTIKLPDPADIVDLNKMSYTTPDPANYARFDKDFDTTGYTGQYNPNNSAYSLDATTNLKQQGLGRLGPDSGIANRVAMRESLKFVTLPVDQLIDRELTAMSWVVNESMYSNKQRGVWLTQAGTYAVFENIDRYRLALMEKAGVPGSTRPEYYRPDMTDGPGKASKPGIIGRGLNWLDQKTKAVGGALSNFGHQFTTDVTKEKLKMNWHQAGKPSDSNQLAAWLVTQGVPQQVVSGVFKKMNIPYIPNAEPQATEPQATKPQATGPKTKELGTGTGEINPATGRPWTPSELKAKYAQPQPTAPTPEPGPAPATTTPSGPPGFNAGNLAQLPGMAQYMQQKPAAPKPAANYGQSPAAYGKTTMSVGPTATKSTTAAPAGKKPTTQQQQEYYKSLGLAEDLSWSKNFDPGRSLYRQMKK